MGLQQVLGQPWISKSTAQVPKHSSSAYRGRQAGQGRRSGVRGRGRDVGVVNYSYFLPTTQSNKSVCFTMEVFYGLSLFFTLSFTGLAC